MRLFLKILPISILFLSCKSRVSNLSDLSVKNVIYYLDDGYVKRLECDADEPKVNRSCSGIVVLLEADIVRKLKNSLVESSDPKLIEELGLSVLADIVREDPARYKEKSEIIETLLDPEQQVELTNSENIEFLDRIFHGRATVEVKQVSDYEGSTCALIGNGKVKCWGTNRNDIGYGRKFEQIAAASPQTTQPFKNAISVANGGRKVCALLREGEVKCLGVDLDDELHGSGVIKSMDLTVEMPSPRLKEVSALVVLGQDICAIHEGGKVYCWRYRVGPRGTDAQDASLDASRIDSTVQQILADARSDWSSISADGVLQISGTLSHRCALMKDKTVSCWGSNTWGQLGIGRRMDKKHFETPQKLSLSNVESIALGGGNTCAVLQGGALRCWGLNFLPDSKDDVFDALGEKAVIPLYGVAQMLVSGNYMCALLKEGEVVCWGNGKYFAQGGNDFAGNETGLTNLGIKDVMFIAGGHGHTCMIIKGGRLKCWGENSKNQLGIDYFNFHSGETFIGDHPSETIDKIPFVFPAWKREGWE